VVSLLTERQVLDKVSKREEYMAEQVDPNREKVVRVLKELHDKKILNLDTSLQSMLEVKGLGRLDPGNPIADDIIFHSNKYFLIYKADAAPNIDEVNALAVSIREALSSKKE
jgi:hypothetical protein